MILALQKTVYCENQLHVAYHVLLVLATCAFNCKFGLLFFFFVQCHVISCELTTQLQPHMYVHVDTDDEYFCDNINRTLPGSLVQDIDNPNININPPTESGGGAALVTSLLQPALLLVTLLLATLL